MNTTIMFVATSLILVGAIVTVAMSHAVFADPPPKGGLISYCIKGVIGPCQPTMQLCKEQAIKGEKCIRVVS